MLKNDRTMDREHMSKLFAGVKDLSDYKIIFNQAFANFGSIVSSPVISNQIIYFGSSDDCIYAISDKE
jgi:hypothetical protein